MNRIETLLDDVSFGDSEHFLVEPIPISQGRINVRRSNRGKHLSGDLIEGWRGVMRFLRSGLAAARTDRMAFPEGEFFRLYAIPQRRHDDQLLRGRRLKALRPGDRVPAVLCEKSVEAIRSILVGQFEDGRTKPVHAAEIVPLQDEVGDKRGLEFSAEILRINKCAHGGFHVFTSDEIAPIGGFRHGWFIAGFAQIESGLGLRVGWWRNARLRLRCWQIVIFTFQIRTCFCA